MYCTVNVLLGREQVGTLVNSGKTKIEPDDACHGRHLPPTFFFRLESHFFAPLPPLPSTLNSPFLPPRANKVPSSQQSGGEESLSILTQSRFGPTQIKKGRKEEKGKKRKGGNGALRCSFFPPSFLHSLPFNVLSPFSTTQAATVETISPFSLPFCREKDPGRAGKGGEAKSRGKRFFGVASESSKALPFPPLPFRKGPEIYAGSFPLMFPPPFSRDRGRGHH